MVEGQKFVKPVLLGRVNAPSGRIVLLDPGLLNHWQADREPKDSKTPGECDLKVVGPDAVAAGRAFDRSWHPLYLYDFPDPKELAAEFAEKTGQRCLKASLEVIEGRVSHRKRVELAIEYGNGVGEFPYDWLWAVAAEVPRAGAFTVFGTPMGDDEFGNRWRHIDLVIREGEPESQEDIGFVMVDHGLLLFSDVDALGHWQFDPFDGLADFTFEGPDAPALAKRFGAEELPDGRFGWRNEPWQEVRDHTKIIEDAVKQEKLRVCSDYRPHGHYHLLRTGLEESAEDSAVLEITGAKLCGFGNSCGTRKENS